MKVSLNWAQSLSNVPLNDIGTDKLVEKIGSQLGAVEEVIHYGPRYDGIIVAKIVTCEKHGDADKLSVCKIDDNGAIRDIERDSNGHIQVICGAPNAQEGLLVAWLPPGSTVPSSLEKEPFVLEARVIRGQLSNGMLASPHELGISENHDCILEIDPNEAKPGQPFKELYGLDDVIIDIENKMFTHRPDCFGVLGVAREIAGIQGKKFVSPEWYLNDQAPTAQNQDIPVHVTIDDPNSVQRFLAVSIKDITVGPSPTWLQAGLNRVGLKPINNIVDITNYIMYITGQPLHAYDADKLPLKGDLRARQSVKGETINLLNGKEIELQDTSTIVIASGDKAIGIGGVMGGKDTEVSPETKNIIIECASFDMYSIRRTSMAYGLFTDAVTRFNKGQSSSQNTPVLVKAIEMTLKLAGGEQACNIVDEASNQPKLSPVKVNAEFINNRLGTKLTNIDIANMLENVEFDIVVEDELNVVAPFWRTDIEIPEDIVEEIGRLQGYDNLPLDLPTKSAKPAGKNVVLEFKSQLRTILSSAGGNELLTYSFVHGNLIDKAGQNVEHAFQLSNALSPDLQYFRMSLVPSLLEKIHPNIKTGHDKFVLFEMSKTHSKVHGKEHDLPKELDSLAGVYANQTAKEPAYFSVRKLLDYLASKLGLEFDYRPIGNEQEYPATTVFENSRSAKIFVHGNSEAIGIVGEFTAGSRKALKLPDATAGFELDIAGLLNSIKDNSSYMKLSKYPSVQQDISLRVPATSSYQGIHTLLSEQILNKPGMVSTLNPIDIYKRENDNEHIQMTFRLVIAHYDKTLKSEEVNKMLDEAAQVAKDKLGAERL